MLADIKRQAFLDLLDEVGVDITITPDSIGTSVSPKAHRILKLEEQEYANFERFDASRVYRVLASEIPFNARNATLQVGDDRYTVVYAPYQDDDKVIKRLYVQ